MIQIFTSLEQSQIPEGMKEDPNVTFLQVQALCGSPEIVGLVLSGVGIALSAAQLIIGARNRQTFAEIEGEIQAADATKREKLKIRFKSISGFESSLQGDGEAEIELEIEGGQKIGFSLLKHGETLSVLQKNRSE